MLNQLSVQDFILQTASDAPVPGGGSISALCGALSAALAKMVAGLTVGKKNYEAVTDKMQEVVDKMPAFIDTLSDLVEKDSESFDFVMKAFKLPKDTDEAKQLRRKAIDDATVYAAQIPLKTAQTVASMFDTLEFVAEFGNKNAMSDIAVATMLARTAIFGALYNVRINLSSLPEGEFKQTTAQEVEKLHALAESREKEILAKVKI